LWVYGESICQFIKGDKVDLVDPKDKKKIVTNRQVEGVVGENFHFKKIEKGVCKVAMWMLWMAI
jgi:hypothetical protein